MPKRAKSSAASKEGRARRSKAEVQAILDKIDALRAQGKSITAALREVNVPYTNYNYWTKKQGKSSAKRGVGSSAGATKLTGKAVQMQNVLNEIQQARAAGQSLDNAIKSKGLTVSNYYYWVKTLAKKSGGSVGRSGSRMSAGSGSGTVGILDEMRRNREERERLGRQVQALDNDFNVLLRKLGSV